MRRRACAKKEAWMWRMEEESALTCNTSCVSAFRTASLSQCLLVCKPPKTMIEERCRLVVLDGEDHSSNSSSLCRSALHPSSESEYHQVVQSDKRSRSISGIS